MDANQIIDALGGDLALATRLGVARTTVYWWREKGIPADRALELADLASGMAARLQAVTLEAILKSPSHKTSPEPKASTPGKRAAKPSRDDGKMSRPLNNR